MENLLLSDVLVFMMGVAVGVVLGFSAGLAFVSSFRKQCSSEADQLEAQIASLRGKDGLL